MNDKTIVTRESYFKTLEDEILFVQVSKRLDEENTALKKEINSLKESSNLLRIEKDWYSEEIYLCRKTINNLCAYLGRPPRGTDEAIKYMY